MRFFRFNNRRLLRGVFCLFQMVLFLLMVSFASANTKGDLAILLGAFETNIRNIGSSSGTAIITDVKVRKYDSRTVLHPTLAEPSMYPIEDRTRSKVEFWCIPSQHLYRYEFSILEREYFVHGKKADVDIKPYIRGGYLKDEYYVVTQRDNIPSPMEGAEVLPKGAQNLPVVELFERKKGDGLKAATVFDPFALLTFWGDIETTREHFAAAENTLTAEKEDGSADFSLNLSKENGKYVLRMIVTSPSGQKFVESSDFSLSAGLNMTRYSLHINDILMREWTSDYKQVGDAFVPLKVIKRLYNIDGELDYHREVAFERFDIQSDVSEDIFTYENLWPSFDTIRIRDHVFKREFVSNTQNKSPLEEVARKSDVVQVENEPVKDEPVIVVREKQSTDQDAESYRSIAMVIISSIGGFLLMYIILRFVYLSFIRRQDK